MARILRNASIDDHGMPPSRPTIGCSGRRSAPPLNRSVRRSTLQHRQKLSHPVRSNRGNCYETGNSVSAALALLNTGVNAAEWQSLGSINALTAMPDTQRCQQRVVNNYWSSKPAFLPTTINTYAADSVEFVFNVDLRSLRLLTSNSPSYSKFKTALDAYYARTTAKSLSGAVSVGSYPRVSINVSYADAAGLVQGLGYGVASNEIQYSELQQLCPQ